MGARLYHPSEIFRPDTGTREIVANQIVARVGTSFIIGPPAPPQIRKSAVRARAPYKDVRKINRPARISIPRGDRHNQQLDLGIRPIGLNRIGPSADPTDLNEF